MRKKILLLNTSFRFEGPNDVLWQLARCNDNSRFELIFGCMHEGGPMEELYRQAGFRTHNFGMSTLLDLGVSRRVRDFVQTEKIDLAMAQLLRAEVFGGYGVRLAGRPLILVIQNNDPYRAKWWHLPHHPLSQMAIKWPLKVVAVSAGVKEFILEHQGVAEERVVTIHDAIDPGHFAGLANERDQVRAEFALSPHQVVIGTVARLAPQKGLPNLLQAFTSIARNFRQARLLIVGEGPERKRLEAIIREAGLQDSVILAGFRRDYDRILQGFDIFALPSLWEGLPMSLMAAMASGKAAVASAVAGIPELIRDGDSGMLVPPGDISSLVVKIETLLKDEPLRLRLGNKAREYITANCSASVMAANYHRLWDESLGGKP